MFPDAGALPELGDCVPIGLGICASTPMQRCIAGCCNWEGTRCSSVAAESEWLVWPLSRLVTWRIMIASTMAFNRGGASSVHGRCVAHSWPRGGPTSTLPLSTAVASPNRGKTLLWLRGSSSMSGSLVARSVYRPVKRCNDGDAIPHFHTRLAMT